MPLMRRKPYRSPTPDEEYFADNEYMDTDVDADTSDSEESEDSDDTVSTEGKQDPDEGLTEQELDDQEHIRYVLFRPITQAAFDHFCRVVERVTLASFARSPKRIRVEQDMHYQAWLQQDHTHWSDFLARVIAKASLELDTLMIAIIYLERVEPKARCKREACASETFGLGALILAHKWYHERSYLNKAWAQVARPFNLQDVNRVEKGWLMMLHWSLHVNPAEILERLPALEDILGLPHWD